MSRVGWILVSAVFVAACQKGGVAPGPVEIGSGDFTPYLPVRRGESVESLSKVQCPQWWRRGEVWTCASFRHPVVGGSWGSDGTLEVKVRSGRIAEVEWRKRIPVDSEEVAGLALEATRIARDLEARLGQPIFSNLERSEDPWVGAVARGEFHLRWWVSGSRLVYRVALLVEEGLPRERELALSLTGLDR